MRAKGPLDPRSGAPSTGRNWPGCCGSPGKAFRRVDLTMMGPGCRKSLPNTFLFKGSLKAKFTARTCWKSHKSGWLSPAPQSPPGGRCSSPEFCLGGHLEHLACEERCRDSTSGAKGQDLVSGRSS